MAACPKQEPQQDVNLAGVKALVVEDSKLFRGIYQIYLGEVGCAITFAGNGWEALTHLRQQQPEVIILDVDMPEMDGPTFMRYFSKTAGYRRVPVIIATSRVEADIDPQALLQASGYLKKPFGPTALIGKLRSVLGG